MIQADHRTGFREPVSLDYHVTQRAPELFRIAIQGCPSGDGRPELPAELAVNSPESPPALEKALAFSRCQLLPRLAGKLALDFLLQRLHHSGHRHQHRDPVTADGGQDLARLKARLKDDRSANQARNKHAHVLPEHMAQRKHVEKADRMKNALVLEVFGNLPLDGI